MSFSILKVLGIAFALACDAFSVGLALGTRGLDWQATARLWLSFGFFQFIMPLLGWFVGGTLLDYIGNYGHYVACGLLMFIAINMARESFAQEEESIKDPTRGWGLLSLALATSIDALGVGVSMGIAEETIFVPSVIIGIVAALMTYSGVKLGSKLSAVFGKRTELLGAVVLLVIAIKLLPIT